MVCILQEIFAYFDPAVGQVADRRDSVVAREFVTQIILIQMAYAGKLFHIGAIAVVGIQISLDEGAFFAWMKGWKQLKIRDSKTAELRNQNGKRVFADLFITIIFFIQFLKKRMKIK